MRLEFERFHFDYNNRVIAQLCIAFAIFPSIVRAMFACGSLAIDSIYEYHCFILFIINLMKLFACHIAMTIDSQTEKFSL